MLEVAQLIAEAHAAATAPPAPPAALDTQTLMAVVGGIVSGIVLGIGGLLARQANGAKGKPPASVPAPILTPPGEAAELFFSGTAKAILDRLAANSAILEGIAALHYETREQVASAMQTTRHDLRGAVHAIGQDTEQDAEEIKIILRAMSQQLGLLDQYMRLSLDQVRLTLDQIARGRS